MYCKGCGKEIRDGVKKCPGGGAAAQEQPGRKKSPVRFGAAFALAAVMMLVLVLTGCGKKSRFSSPLEYYRHVETAAMAEAAENFVEAYDGALRKNMDASGGKTDTELELELFEPATDMLKTYTGMDFSWLKTLGLTADVNLAEDGAAAELALLLNGRELIGAEVLADLTSYSLYGRIPLLSEEYFYDTGSMDLRYLTSALSLKEGLSDALPDGEFFTELLSRCTEAALEYVEDVEQGSDTLSAGGVSAKYATLTVTLTDEQLRDMAKEVRGILKKDTDIEDFFLELEELAGAALYDDFLNALDQLPGSVVPEEDLVMTLYVDEDDIVRGRVIEYDGYIFRCAMPEARGEFGFEVRVEDAEDEEILWSVSGDGERDDDTVNGTFVFEMEETKLFTILIEDLDTGRTSGGMHPGRVTVRPTYEYYTYFGVYSLTARALEDFSYTLKVEEDGAAFEVYMDGDPFLTLTVRAESGPAEALPAVSGAADVNSWAMSLVLGGGLENYINYLAESDIPPELLQRLLGVLF